MWNNYSRSVFCITSSFVKHSSVFNCGSYRVVSAYHPVCGFSNNARIPSPLSPVRWITTGRCDAIASTSTSCSSAAGAKKEADTPESLHDDFIRSRIQLNSKQRLMGEPEDTEPHIIYKGLLTGQMRRLKVFSLTTTGLGLMMQPILIEKASEVPMAANIAVFSMVGFFTFVTPFLIHKISKKYVTEMEYDPKSDTYTATTFNFFLQKKLTVFKMEDLNVPEVPGPFTSLQVKVGDNKYQPFFVAPESFLRPSHYGRFMGYDKPIDLRLSTNNVENSNETEKSSGSKK